MSDRTIRWWDRLAWIALAVGVTLILSAPACGQTLGTSDAVEAEAEAKAASAEVAAAAVRALRPVDLPHPATRAWRISQTALTASAVADVLSSRGLTELNPLAGRGPFGARQTAIVLGATAGSLALQEIAVRRRWIGAKVWVWVNWVGTLGHTGAAAHNFRQR